MEKVKLGDEVKDRVTGFRGIALARVVYLYGCQRILIAPPAKKNQKVDPEWFDEDGVEIVGKGVNKEMEKKKTGGMRTDMPTRSALP